MKNLFEGKKVIDISLSIDQDTPVYPGDYGVKVNQLKSIKNGDGYNLSSIAMGVHTGTHLDAPTHFIEGAKRVDQIPPDQFMGTAQVVEILDKKKITRQELEKKDITENIILFKTGNSMRYSGEFIKDYVYLTEEAGRYLVEKGIKLIGIDYLSIEKYPAEEAPVHKFLLGKGLVILEGLNLSNVEEGIYTLIALPLKIKGAEGSPTRAVLIK